MLKRFQNKSAILFSVAVAGAMLHSCTKDFVEPDMSKKTVTLLAPANGYKSTSLTQLFWWEKVKDAATYNLQVVSPGFSGIQTLLLDTNLTANQFSFTLHPGVFEWRVKAFNGSSESPYTVFAFSVDSTVNLSGQTLTFLSPDDKLQTKKMRQTFSWTKLYNAEEYRFQVINSYSVSVFDLILKEDTITRTLPEGVFTWQVRALNASSVSLYSSRTITIDTTAPPVSQQLFPADKDTIKTTDSLAWSRNSSATADSLFVYKDAQMTSLVNQYRVGPQTYFRFPGKSKQDYYWRLRSVDAAGNCSPLGPLIKFSVK